MQKFPVINLPKIASLIVIRRNIALVRQPAAEPSVLPLHILPRCLLHCSNSRVRGVTRPAEPIAQLADPHRLHRRQVVRQDPRASSARTSASAPFVHHLQHPRVARAIERLAFGQQDDRRRPQIAGSALAAPATPRAACRSRAPLRTRASVAAYRLARAWPHRPDRARRAARETRHRRARHGATALPRARSAGIGGSSASPLSSASR